MSIELASWLKHRRDAFAECWSSGGVATAGGLAELPDGWLESIYTALVAAAEGDLSPLEAQAARRPLDGSTPPPPLHAMLQGAAELRRQAWRLLSADERSLDAALPLLEQLEDLFDRATGAMARRWEEEVAATLQDRVSQAEFIAESLAQATEESDATALQLSMLNEMSQRLSSLLDRDQVTELVGDQLFALLRVEQLAIWLVEDDALALARSYGSPAPTVATIAVSGDPKTHDMLQRAHQFGMMAFDTAPDAELQGAWYTPGCGVLAVPFVTGSHSIGVVVAQDPQAEELLPRTQHSLAFSIAAQAAIALQNARLYDAIRRFNADLEQRIAARTSELKAERDRLETLYEIALEVGSTLNLDLLLNSALQALARLSNVAHGSIMLIDLETEHLVDRAVLGKNSVGFTRFPIGHGLAGWVAQHKKSVLVNDVQQDQRWVAHPNSNDDSAHKRGGSIIAVPLIAQDQILGVLTLSHDDVGYFNDDHLRLLNAIGSQIGIAVHNALLYDQIFSEVNRRGELLRYQELEASKNAAILQSLSDGVVVCGTDGTVLLVNTAAERMLDRSVSDLLTWNLHDMLKKLIPARPQTIEELDGLLGKPLDQHEQPRTARVDFRLGPRTISLTLGPVMTTKGELLGVVAVFRDITREVESDRIKTEFIGTVSHELRTPMTSIKGYTQLLAMGSLGEINDTQREFLGTIQNNAERMIIIINDLLDITKIETGSVELDIHPHHLAEILSSVIGEQQAAISARDHELSINMAASLPLALVDGRSLHKIIANLLSNAVKYTPRAGKIVLEAREVTLDALPPEVVERLRPARRWVRVDISDSGVGIAPEELERVFERFYRTDNPLKIEAGGTGLGLSLVRSLVYLLGGDIWVRSTLNEGSTFSLVIPAM
jgi:signal transduction histidine kinase